MNEKITAAWQKVQCFWMTQQTSFYVGMALSVLILLNLKSVLSLYACMAICPFATPVLYLLMRALSESPATWVKNLDVKGGVLASVFGSLWTVILTLL